MAPSTTNTQKKHMFFAAFYFFISKKKNGKGEQGLNWKINIKWHQKKNTRGELFTAQSIEYTKKAREKNQHNIIIIIITWWENRGRGTNKLILWDNNHR